MNKNVSQETSIPVTQLRLINYIQYLIMSSSPSITYFLTISEYLS